MKKKKIIFFANNLCIGGIESSLIELLNRINYEKYEVTLTLEKKEGQNLSKLNSNVVVKTYKFSKSNKILFRKIKNFIYYLKWYMLNHNKYDFSCNYATYLFWGSKLARTASKNNSIYIHSDYTKTYTNIKNFLDFFQKLKIKKFQNIIFVSNESRKNFVNIFPELNDHCIVINNFIDEDRVLLLSSEKIEEKKPKNKTLFTFVGRLDEDSKKISKLIKCVKFLNENKKNVELWIIGAGKDKDKYIEMIAQYKLTDNIKLLGPKTNPYPYMKISDYILLTSRYEGFPVVFLESIILEKKIITTISVSDEYISIDNKFGYIVNQDQNRMNSQILNILNNDNLDYEKISFKEMNKKRLKCLESFFDKKH